MPFFCHTLLLPYLSDLSDKDIGSKGGCPVRDVNPHWVYFTIAIDLGHVWKKIFWKKSQVILTLALFSGVLEKKKRFPFPIPIHQIPFLKERPSFLKVGWKKLGAKIACHSQGLGKVVRMFVNRNENFCNSTSKRKGTIMKGICLESPKKFTTNQKTTIRSSNIIFFSQLNFFRVTDC